MNFRQASQLDAPWLASLNQQLILDEGHRNPMSLAQLETRMAGWLAAEYRAVLFEDGPGPIGYALFRDDVEFVYLRQFYVVPLRRRQGLGRAAIAWLVANMWSDGRAVRLDVLVGNQAAIAFWRRVGFVDYCITMERPAGLSGDRSAAPREQV